MPVYQVYFPDSVAAEIQRVADEEKTTTKIYIQSAVGEALRLKREQESDATEIALPGKKPRPSK